MITCDTQLGGYTIRRLRLWGILMMIADSPIIHTTGWTLFAAIVVTKSAMTWYTIIV